MNNDLRTADLSLDEVRFVITSAIGMGAMILQGGGELAISKSSPETMRSEYPDPAYGEATSMLQTQLLELAGAFGDPCPHTVRELLQTCLEAAWILGARKAAMLPSRDRTDVCSKEKLSQLRGWEGAWCERLVTRLIAELRRLGWALLGDPNRMLEPVEPLPDIFRSSSPSGSPEFRTTWIAGAGRDRSYQWCVSREDACLRVSRRQQGNRGRDREFSVTTRDAEILREMLERVTAIEPVDETGPSRALEVHR